MTRRRWFVCGTSFSLVWTVLIAGNLPAESARSPRGMVATVHPLATAAGVAAMKQGGNAVDAAVAAAVTLGVVDAHNSGLGGGCFVLIRCPDGKFVAIDGREMAPARAHREMFLQDGKAQPEWSTTGPLAVGTPGALAAYDRAVREHGRLPLAAALLPAADIAEKGFPIDRVFAGNIRSNRDRIARFPAASHILLHTSGEPKAEGEIVRQPDLARTYRQIAEQGTGWFYQGEFAQRVGAWMQEHGGLLSATDFAQYRTELREPLLTTYRGHTIVGFPPPSSGGVHVAQILKILETFDLRSVHAEDPVKFTHIVAEAMKLAFADRAHWLGDPAFAKVPRGLVADDYARDLARRIDVDHAATDVSHGDPPGASTDWFGKHTTHIAAADAAGYWVGITATVNTSFGSKVVVPGTGVFLNNEMDDFSIQPGVPNAFGLVGAEANAVAPGKRPLSSMSPTIILKDGQPVLTLGAAGGPTIINQVVLGIVRTIDLGLPLTEAIGDPRFHHQWSPAVLTVEKSFPAEWRERLQARGHDIKQRDSLGVSQGISWLPQEQQFLGVHDPRVPGAAAGR